MKKKVSISSIWFFVLMIGLILSCFINIVQLVAGSYEKPLVLKGSYCVDVSAPIGTTPYLVFDDKGHYCKYTQTDGILDEGVYTQDSSQQYHLVGKSGFPELIILEEDGVYDISDCEGLSSTFFPRFSDVLVFFSGCSPSWAEQTVG